MGILILEGIRDLFTGQVFLGRAMDPMGFDTVEDWTVWMVQAYFLVVVILELSERARTLPRFRFHPATLFIFSAALILSGTGLLMLPEMTTDGLGMTLSDALFTSTSATCVTGLMVQDAETFFTHKGHVVLMVLIKLGGLNIIAFGSLLALLARFGVGVRQHDVIEDFVNRGASLAAAACWAGSSCGASPLKSSVPGAFPVLAGRPVREHWRPHFPEPVLVHQRVQQRRSASSAADWPTPASEAWLVHWMVTLLVFLGALGMVAIFDLFSRESLRERMKNPWRQIRFPTKIALYYSLALVGFGAIVTLLLESGSGGNPRQHGLDGAHHHGLLPKRHPNQRIQHRRHRRHWHPDALSADHPHVHRCLQLFHWRVASRPAPSPSSLPI